MPPPGSFCRAHHVRSFTAYDTRHGFGAHWSLFDGLKIEKHLNGLILHRNLCLGDSRDFYPQWHIQILSPYQDADAMLHGFCLVHDI